MLLKEPQTHIETMIEGLLNFKQQQQQSESCFHSLDSKSWHVLFHSLAKNVLTSKFMHLANNNTVGLLQSVGYKKISHMLNLTNWHCSNVLNNISITEYVIFLQIIIVYY